MKKKQNRRLLCRSLAKELKPEDIGQVQGGDPPSHASTLAATLPDFHEDQ